MDGHKPIPIHDLRKANALENKDQWLKWRKEGIGGSDKYENLVLVLAPVHELIHAVDEDTICSYLSALKLDASQLAKLNKLRILANRKPIDLENLNLTNNSHNGMTKETKKTV